MLSHVGALLILILCGLAFGYLSGSILWSVIIGKLFFNKDPRNFNSKNAGATNSTRVFGKKVGFIILLLDVLKSFIPTIIMWLIAKYAMQDSLQVSESFSDYSLLYLTSFGALIGHCYPLYFKFQGGKAASTIGAMLLAISPWLTLLALVIWVLIILIWRYVSLASILGSVIIIFLVFIPGVNWMYMLNINMDQLLVINGFNTLSVLLVSMLLMASSIVLIWRHKTNIARLINHTERKIGALKDY